MARPARPNGTTDVGPARNARLLAEWRAGTSQRALARAEGCTQPNIAQMLRRARAIEAGDPFVRQPHG